MLLRRLGDVRDVLLRLSVRPGRAPLQPAARPASRSCRCHWGSSSVPASRRRSFRAVGVRNVSVVGLALATAGVLWMTRRAGSRPLRVGPAERASCRCRSGWAWCSCRSRCWPPLVSANDDAGLASGLFNSAQQVGGSLGLAILATLSVDHTTSLIKQGAVSASPASPHRVRLPRGVPGGGDHDGRRRRAAGACSCARGTSRAVEFDPSAMA